MDDVDTGNSFEGASLDDSASDSQSQMSGNASPATRWLSDRFHFDREPRETEEDVFDVNQWPSFAPIATSIGINKQRFLFSAARPRLPSLNQSDKERLDDTIEEQETTQNDTDMEERDEKLSHTMKPQSESSLQDTIMTEVSYDEQMMRDVFFNATESPSPSSSSQLERSNGIANSIPAEHAKDQTQSNVSDGAGPVKVKGKKTDEFGRLTPFRRMIQSPTKKALAVSANSETEDDADDGEEMGRFTPITLQEKRRRQAKRAEQLKFWRVREEREAREVRRANRRDVLEGRLSNSKQSISCNNESSTATIRKVVKFNLKRNRVIQFDDPEVKDTAA